MSLDVRSRVVTPLTKNKGVNVEPHWSPDGQNLRGFRPRAPATSTSSSAKSLRRESPASRSGPSGEAVSRGTTDSPFDHEISPTWSPDGKELIYVSNPENVYGTGGIYRRALSANAEPVPVRLEETTWKARPAWSPDGKRVLYSSYEGRQWHDIWITTAAGGGDPLPLTYGDLDDTSVRWSPDASRIRVHHERRRQHANLDPGNVGRRERKLRFATSPSSAQWVCSNCAPSTKTGGHPGARCDVGSEAVITRREASIHARRRGVDRVRSHSKRSISKPTGLALWCSVPARPGDGHRVARAAMHFAQQKVQIRADKPRPAVKDGDRIRRGFAGAMAQRRRSRLT